MQEKKKRNRILMLLIVGMLLIYAFTDIENVKINRERKIFFSSASQNVLKQAANWLLPGLTYVKEGRKDTLTGRIEKSVLSFVPISEYVRNHEEPETTVDGSPVELAHLCQRLRHGRSRKFCQNVWTPENHDYQQRSCKCMSLKEQCRPFSTGCITFLRFFAQISDHHLTASGNIL